MKYLALIMLLLIAGCSTKVLRSRSQPECKVAHKEQLSEFLIECINAAVNDYGCMRSEGPLNRVEIIDYCKNVGFTIICDSVKQCSIVQQTFLGEITIEGWEKNCKEKEKNMMVYNGG